MTTQYRFGAGTIKTYIATSPTPRAYHGWSGTCLLATACDGGTRVGCRPGRHRQACPTQRSQRDQPALHRAVTGDVAAGCARSRQASAEAENIGSRTEFRTDFGQARTDFLSYLILSGSRPRRRLRAWRRTRSTRGVLARPATVHGHTPTVSPNPDRLIRLRTVASSNGSGEAISSPPRKAQMEPGHANRKIETDLAMHRERLERYGPV
jgi:hypothetical protein